MKMEKDTVLCMRGISKSFGTNRVLHGVDFELKRGEVHALLGENGAGKSTLLNILTGTFKADEGSISINGNVVDVRNLSTARQMGIVRVHQELQLVREMTVGQNIFLGREPRNGLNLIDYDRIYREADEVLKRLDADFSSKDTVANLSTAQQQLIEISKAILQDFIILALDEPTSSLTKNEIEKLMITIDKLRRDGKAIIYVSHRMEEIFRITDRATILRDGRLIGVVDTKETNRAELIKMMVGRDISEQRFNLECHATDEIALEVRGLTGRGFENVSFHVRRGEVLGFSGLVGAGRTEVMRAIFGIDRISSGEILVSGKKTVIRSPLDAQSEGIMLIPEDRKYQGLVGSLKNKDNIALSNLRKYAHRGVISHREILKDAKYYMDLMKVSPPDENMPTRSLSGGNQQKVVIGRILNVKPNILILDEPTRGIDINVKFEIYKLIRQLADEGMAIIMISSEMPEIISLSDRVMVMYEGRVTGELNSRELSEESIMTYAMGGKKDE